MVEKAGNDFYGQGIRH